jgi:hypothetical protein
MNNDPTDPWTVTNVQGSRFIIIDRVGSLSLELRQRIEHIVDRFAADMRTREMMDRLRDSDAFLAHVIEDLRLAAKRDYYWHRVESRRRELYRDGVPAMRSVCSVRPISLVHIPRIAREPSRARCTGWHPRRSRR